MEQQRRDEASVPPTGSYAGAGEPAPGGRPDAGTAAYAVSRPKADLVKRIVAAVIDGVIGAVVNLIPIVGGIIAGAYWLFRDGLELEFMDRRSIGKKIMKLRPVTLDGTPMDLATSARRNWMFALGGLIALLFWIPFIGWLLIVPVAIIALILGIVEIVLVLTDPQGRRLGDRMAKTQVIEVPE